MEVGTSFARIGWGWGRRLREWIRNLIFVRNSSVNSQGSDSLDFFSTEAKETAKRFSRVSSVQSGLSRQFSVVYCSLTKEEFFLMLIVLGVYWNNFASMDAGYIRRRQHISRMTTARRTMP